MYFRCENNRSTVKYIHFDIHVINDNRFVMNVSILYEKEMY